MGELVHQQADLEQRLQERKANRIDHLHTTEQNIRKVGGPHSCYIPPVGAALFCSEADIAGILPVVQFRILPLNRASKMCLIIGSVNYGFTSEKCFVSFRAKLEVLLSQILAWFGKFLREDGEEFMNWNFD